MHYKNNIIIAFLLVITGLSVCMPAASARAQGAGDLFIQANELYTAGEFEHAVELYNKILYAETAVSPEVYYNIGNAYYRLQKPGKAILSWERALLLKPRDKDIRYNLNFVKSRLFTDPQGKRALDIIIEWLKRSAALNEIAVFCALFYALGMLVLLGYIFLKKPFLLKGVVFFSIVLMLSLGWMFILYRHTITLSRAIVIAQTAEVHNGPDTGFKVGFTVTEGAEAVLMREKGDWQEIGITDKGLKGWVKKDVIEKI